MDSKTYILEAHDADGSRVAHARGTLASVLDDVSVVGRQHEPKAGRSDRLTFEIRPVDYKPRYEPPKEKMVAVTFRDAAPLMVQKVTSVILNGDFFTLSTESGETMVRASEVVHLVQRLPAPPAEPT